jgi:hypothetical protein
LRVEGVSLTVAPILSYATPRTSSRFLPWYLLFLSCTAIPAITIFLLLVFFVSRFSVIFAQFGGELPMVGRIALILSHIAQNVFLLPVWLILLGAFPLLPGRLCARQTDSRRRIVGLVLSLLFLLAAFLLALLFIYISTILALNRLMEIVH